MSVIRTELDALLERVREDKADTTGKNRNAVVYDCWRMFEDVATRFKEESAMRERYKAQSNCWRDKAFELDEVNQVLHKAVSDALQWYASPRTWNLSRPDTFGDRARKALAELAKLDKELPA